MLPPEARRRFEMPKVGRQTSVEILEAVRVADQFLAWIFTASRKGANKDPESIEYDSKPRMKNKMRPDCNDSMEEIGRDQSSYISF